MIFFKPKFYHGFAFDRDVSLRERIKYAIQRHKRGFDDTELWNLDETLSKFIYPRLKVFIENEPHGYPGHLELCYPSKLKGDRRSKHYHKLWISILHKMLKAFEPAKDKGAWLDSLGHTPTKEDWQQYNDIIDEGLRLFSKHYFGLWD